MGEQRESKWVHVRPSEPKRIYVASASKQTQTNLSESNCVQANPRESKWILQPSTKLNNMFMTFPSHGLSQLDTFGTCIDRARPFSCTKVDDTKKKQMTPSEIKWVHVPNESKRIQGNQRDHMEPNASRWVQGNPKESYYHPRNQSSLLWKFPRSANFKT